MNHFITLKEAVAMTTLYRNNKEIILASDVTPNTLVNSESFTRGDIDKVLAQPDCTGIRVYYGMDELLRVHAILVGFDQNNHDLVGSGGMGAGLEDDDPKILDKGTRCPDECPPPSPLNP